MNHTIATTLLLTLTHIATVALVLMPDGTIIATVTPVLITGGTDCAMKTHIYMPNRTHNFAHSFLRQSVFFTSLSRNGKPLLYDG